MKIEEREKACFDLLKKLPPDKYVLIGGCATSAFDFPRFSVDLDIVIRKEDQEFFINLLEGEGFRQTQSKKLAQVYEGEFIRFERGINGLAVNADLLVNMIQSRQTNSAYSFDYLLKHSEVREVVGSALDTRVRARVADREMLITLKVNSMRLADQRDIIALCNGNVDVDKVVKHLRRCPEGIIKENIDRLLGTLRDPSSRDSIKGVFSLADKAYQRVIDRTEKLFKKLKQRLG